MSIFGNIKDKFLTGTTPPPKKGMGVELGGTGTEFFAGFISSEEYNPKLQGQAGLKIYDEMRRSDGMVRATMLAVTLPIRQAVWRVEPASDSPKDKEIADFVSDNLFGGMSITWADFLRQALLHLPFGYMMFEKVLKLEDDKLKYAKLAPRLPKTLWRWNVDDNQELISMTQFVQKGTSFVYPTIPADKLLLFTNEQEGANYEGLALALDTVIPTPDGFTTVGELQEGSKVFDEQGRIRYVVATKEWDNRNVYEVSFSNGEKIIADENHQWLVEAGARRLKRIVTTKEMADNVKINKGKVNNYCVPVAKPVQYPRQNLLIEPYVLGWWLSDGSKNTAEITSKDEETEELLSGKGYELKKKKQPREHAATYRLSNLQLQLRVLNLLYNKHVPDEYKVGSVDQRFSIIQGLMDGDGTVDRWGRCEFTNTSKNLVDSLREILASLGIKSSCQKVKPSGSRKLDIYRVHFITKHHVFRLTRKVERQINPTERTRRIFIANIKYVGKRKTKCIEVDSPSHLFLCGRTFIPTHNSLLRSAYKHWFIKNTLYKIDAIKHDRWGVGIPKVTMPQGKTKENDPVAWAAAISMAEGLRANERAYVIEPFGYKIDMMQMGSRVGTNALPSIQHHNEQIVVNILAQFLTLGSTQTGARALGDSFKDLFLLSLQSVAIYTEDILNRDAIKPLVDLNYNTDKYPKLKASSIREPGFSSMAEAVNKLVSSGSLTNDEAMENHIREVGKLPAKMKSESNPNPNPKPTKATEGCTCGHDHPIKLTVNGFRRELFDCEKVLNLREIDSKVSKTEASLVRKIKKIQSEQIEQLAKSVVANPATAKTKKVGRLSSEIKGELLDIFRFGRGQVKSELEKQKTKPLKLIDDRKSIKGLKKAKINPLRTPEEAQAFIESKSNLIASQMAKKLENTALFAELEAQKLGLTKAASITFVTDRLAELSDREATLATQNSVVEALGIGRNVEAETRKEDIATAFYSAILDGSVCENCEPLDGQEHEFNDPAFETPNPRCLGGDKCRCITIYVLKTEEAAVVR